MHAERGKGHFIGAVDKNGIADFAGLETAQRIVGVNGQLIYPTTAHKVNSITYTIITIKNFF